MKTAIPIAGDLLLVKGKGVLSRAIEGVTHSPYSHVAMFVDPETLIEAQGFRRVGYQDPEVYRGQADLFRCEWLRMEKRLEIVAEAEKHIGEHYDYPLIALELLQHTTGIVIPWYEHHTKICSTLIGSAYRKKGISVCKGIWKPTPGDLSLDWHFKNEGAFC